MENDIIKNLENEGQLNDINVETLIESMDDFDIEWEKRFGNTVNKPMTLEDHNKLMNEMKQFTKEWKNK